MPIHNPKTNKKSKRNSQIAIQIQKSRPKSKKPPPGGIVWGTFYD